MDKEWQKLQQQVAEKNDVSADCVETEIRLLIDRLWDEPDGKAKKYLMQAGWGNKPTPFQLIGYLANAVRTYNPPQEKQS